MNLDFSALTACSSVNWDDKTSSDEMLLQYQKLEDDEYPDDNGIWDNINENDEEFDGN